MRSLIYILGLLLQLNGMAVAQRRKKQAQLIPAHSLIYFSLLYPTKFPNLSTLNKRKRSMRALFVDYLAAFTEPKPKGTSASSRSIKDADFTR